MRGCAALLAAALLLTACAASLPARYQRARAAAERSYAHGRYDEAARHWLAAADAAARRYDRNEARYRAAVSLWRARRHEEAQAMYTTLARERHMGERAARVDFDLAALLIERGETERGHALLEEAIAAHPASGLSRAALARHLEWLRERGGSQAVLSWIDSARALEKTVLAESLSYLRAKELERSGNLKAAREAYLATAERFSYPSGAHWDDALFHASLIDEQLGRYRPAIAHLRRMLAEREPSHLQGSYERPRFAAAQYRIAELYRDRLGDPHSARREFRRVFSEHVTSVLRDDALWNEALLAARARDHKAACEALGLIGRELSDSRYVACAPALCPALAAPKSASCRPYILRQLGDLSSHAHRR